MNNELYQRKMKEARKAEKKNLAYGSLFKFLSDAALIWGGQRVTPDYSGVRHRASAPVRKLEEERQLLTQKSLMDLKKEDLQSRISERDLKSQASEKINKSGNFLVSQARKELKSRGYELPENADLNYLKTAKELGLLPFLPASPQSGTIYDKDNKPSLVVFDKNRPGKISKIGEGKKDILTDAYGNKRLNGKPFNIDFRENKSGGYADNISEISSPKLRDNAKKYIDQSFKSDKRYQILVGQEDAMARVEALAKEALSNPAASAALTLQLAKLAGNTGAMTDNDVRMFVGSNDYQNWLDRTYNSFVHKRSITQEDFKDVMNYARAIQGEIVRQRRKVINDASQKLKIQVPELSNRGIKNTISGYYKTPSENKNKGPDIPEGFKLYGNLKDYPQINHLKPGQTVSHGSKVFLIGKNGEIYEKG